MILKYTLAIGVLFGAALLAVRWHSPAGPAKTTAAIAERVLAAVAREDYDAFIAQADRSVRRMRSEDFRLLAERHAPRLRSGHDLRPLDERWRGAVHVSRWKVIFKDGSPEAVLTLGTKDGKIATFALY